MFLPFLFILVGISWALGTWVLSPLRAVGVSGTPTQFRLTDIYMLIAQIGGLGLLLNSSDRRQDGWAQYFFIPFAMLFTWWWWLGLRQLSRASIMETRWRIALLNAIPLAYGSPIILMVVGLLAMISSSYTTPADWQPAAFIFIWAVLIGIYAALGGFCRFLIRSALKSRTKPDTAPARNTES